jgi:alkyl sulfatase BDS1-like metallo-beta-lactamase superfamily hydrolase
VLEALAFDDERDYEDVQRGFIAELPDGGVVKDAHGRRIWDLPSWRYAAKSKAPSTVNPSTWRQAQLMGVGGLFEVVPGIYQVRNHDIANVTFIETEDSVVILDTGSVTECAVVARDLYFAHRPQKPIRTIIYTRTPTPIISAGCSGSSHAKTSPRAG